MSLIIDALRKAQQLRTGDIQGVPFFRSRQPSDRRKTGTGKWWFFPILGLICLLIGTGIVLWSPFSSFQERKPLPLIASEREKPPVFVSKEEPEEPAKALPALQAVENPLPRSDSQEMKKEASLSKPIEREQEVKISTPLQRVAIRKPALPAEEASPQPVKTSPPSKEEPPLTPTDEIHETQGALKPPALSTEILILFNQGVLYQNQRETSKAIAAYQRVLELDPAYFEAYNNMGLLYQEIGDFDRAILAYQKSIEINPGYEKALNNLGILYYLKDRYEEALECFQKAIAVRPENLESYLNLGILFKKQGQWDKALDSFQKALTIDPFYGETHDNIALLYEQMNQLELAIDHYQKFIQLSSKTYPVLASKVQRHLDVLSKMKREKGK